MTWSDPRRYLRLARTIVVLIVGGTVVILGVLMIVTPGPALIVVPAGLAILATEFAWARRWLTKLKEAAAAAAAKARGFGGSGKDKEPPGPS